MNEQRRTRVGKGRKLAWAEYGAAQGAPVIFHHGGPSSRLEGRAFHPAASRQGVRLLSVDRPGIGCSDPDPTWTFASYADDIRQLADFLELNTFGVLGVSGGGPPAMACAAALGDRVVRTVSVAGAAYGGLDRRTMLAVMSGSDRAMARLALGTPRLAGAALAPRGWLARRRPPAGIVRALLRGALCPADREVADRFGLWEVLGESVAESFRQGAGGPFRDGLNDVTPWDFNPAAIETPLEIWQGGRDTLVLPQAQEALIERLPQARVRRFPEEGHLLGVARADELLSGFRVLVR